ncbi:MAG TPA: hypothetical protein GX699_06340, partial [Firmicutes bacterium]|nr:hypothetical protein [Bacillota bacterium]
VPAGEEGTLRLTEAEKETLLHFWQGSLQAAATALSDLLAQDVTIAADAVEIMPESLSQTEAEEFLAVHFAYRGELVGKSLFLVDRQEADAIAALMPGAREAGEEFAAIRESALAEAFSQMLGAAMTNIAGTYGFNIYIDTPEISLSGELPPELAEGRQPLVRLTCRLQRAQQPEGRLWQFLSWETVQELLKLLSPRETAIPESFVAGAGPVLPETESREPLLYSANETGDKILPLDMIRDITVRITGVLGRRKVSLKELRSIAYGAVVELDAAAADPVEVLANGRLVARGQIVVHKDHLGIRLTEIITSEEAF